MKEVAEAFAAHTWTNSGSVALSYCPNPSVIQVERYFYLTGICSYVFYLIAKHWN